MSDRDEMDPWWLTLLVFFLPLALVVLVTLVSTDHGCAEWATATIRGCEP